MADRLHGRPQRPASAASRRARVAPVGDPTSPSSPVIDITRPATALPWPTLDSLGPTETVDPKSRPTSGGGGAGPNRTTTTKRGSQLQPLPQDNPPARLSPTPNAGPLSPVRDIPKAHARRHRRSSGGGTLSTGSPRGVASPSSGDAPHVSSPETSNIGTPPHSPPVALKRRVSTKPSNLTGTADTTVGSMVPAALQRPPSASGRGSLSPLRPPSAATPVALRVGRHREVLTHAVVVGVDYYEDIHVPALGHAVRDAIAITALLQQHQYTVTLLHDDQPNPALRPTYTNVVAAIQTCRAHNNAPPLRRPSVAEPDNEGSKAPLLIVFCGRGGVAVAGTSEMPFVATSDLDVRRITQDTVLTLQWLQGPQGEEAVLWLEVYPFLAARGIGAGGGFALATGYQSVGGELKVAYSAGMCGAFTYYVQKGLEGGAMQGSRVTTNSLNSFIGEKLKKRGVKINTNSGPFLNGNLNLTRLHCSQIHVPATDDLWCRLGCIMGFGWERNHVVPLTRLMKTLSGTIPAKKYGVRPLKYRCGEVTHVVFVVEGNADVHLRGKHRRRLDRVMDDVLHKATGGMDVTDSSWELFSPTYLTLGSKKAEVAKDDAGNQYLVIGMPVPTGSPTSTIIAAIRDRYDGGELASLGDCRVCRCGLLVELTFTMTSRVYRRVDKCFRFGWWRRRWDAGPAGLLSVITVRPEDSALRAQDNVATSIQRSWRAHRDRRLAAVYCSTTLQERAARASLVAEWWAVASTFDALSQGGEQGVIAGQETEGRMEVEGWEVEERYSLCRKLQRALGHLETFVRERMWIRCLAEYEEMEVREELWRQYAAVQGFLKGSHRLCKEEGRGRSRVWREERQEWITDIKTQSWLAG